MLENYANTHGFTNIFYYSDDGFSGTNFQRPDWQRMIADVGAVIVKDMSRVGRDYLQVGLYTEVTFREHGVRVIAISNNIDSDNRESTEFAPFLNLLSEWYARDTSRKIKAVINAKGNDGKPLTTSAIYGYRKSPDDKNVWLVDNEPAEVVRRIFQMALNGMGSYQIARQLTAEKMERPSVYFVNNRADTSKPVSRDLSDPYTWSGRTVGEMLSRLEYCGHAVNFRTYSESYKDRRTRDNSWENWKIFHNTHEKIVDQETFDTVQKLRETSRRIDKIGEANPLTGLVFCADCRAKMYNSRRTETRRSVRGNGEPYSYKIADHYTCSTYNLRRSKFKDVCNNHYIRTKVIRELVLDTGYAVFAAMSGKTKRSLSRKSARNPQLSKLKLRKLIKISLLKTIAESPNLITFSKRYMRITQPGNSTMSVMNRFPALMRKSRRS